jgi:hypothetical protein
VNERGRYQDTSGDQRARPGDPACRIFGCAEHKLRVWFIGSRRWRLAHRRTWYGGKTSRIVPALRPRRPLSVLFYLCALLLVQGCAVARPVWRATEYILTYPVYHDCPCPCGHERDMDKR